MIDLNYIWVDIICPKCNYKDEIQLINAKSEISVYCHNCKSSIQLEDKDASIHTSIDTVNKQMKQLQNIFKKFGR